MLQFSLRFSSYFQHAAALNLLPFAVSGKNARMPCDPQKPMVDHDFSLLAASPDACHASRKKAKIKAKTLTNKSPKTIEIASFWSLFQLLARDYQNKHQNGLRSPSPEPPGASRGPPGRAKTVQRGAKSGPRAAKSAPRAAQDRFDFGTLLGFQKRRCLNSFSLPRVLPFS